MADPENNLTVDPLSPLLEENWLGVAEAVAQAAEYRRKDDDSHNARVGELAALIATKLALSPSEIDLIRRAAPLHDVGTIFIPEKILYKPARLDPGEFEVVKSHVGLGANLLYHKGSNLLKMARLIVETHHERWDGSGYPLGLKALKIPIAGQVVAVADTFDSMIHRQPYRAAVPLRDAVAEIESQAGSGFDPQVIAAFGKVVRERYWAPPKAATEGSSEVLLKGRLSSLKLLDLLTMLHQNTQSGTLKLYTSFSEYSVGFYAGQIIDAAFERLRGERALFLIAAKLELSQKTKFIFEAWLNAAPDAEQLSIRKSTEKLLFDIALELDHKQLKAAG